MTTVKRITALLIFVALCLLMGCSADKSGDVTSDAFSSASSTATSFFSAPSSHPVSSRASYVSSKAASSTAPVLSDYVQTIIDDMTLAHEGNPHGVPLSYDWAQKPREGMGTNPGNFTAATAWGQVYEATEGNPATNTRVQLRNMRMYYFSIKQQCWIELQNTVSVKGGAYREDFQGNANKTADQRSESDNGGGVSVTAGDGYNYHFWPTGQRASIDPTDIAVIYSTCQARLILDDPSKPDDRSSARYLLSIGGDYWLDKSAGWQSFKTNGDFAIGRFRYVTTEWQNFSGWAGDENIIRNNPPPKE